MILILILILPDFSRIFRISENYRSLGIVKNYLLGISNLCKWTELAEICPKTQTYDHFIALRRGILHDSNFDFINDFDFDFDFINDFDFDFDFASKFQNDFDFDFDFQNDFDFDFDFAPNYKMILILILIL